MAGADLIAGRQFATLYALQIDLSNRFNLKPMFFLNIYYHLMDQSFQWSTISFQNVWCPSISENCDVLRLWDISTASFSLDTFYLSQIIWCCKEKTKRPGLCVDLHLWGMMLSPRERDIRERKENTYHPVNSKKQCSQNSLKDWYASCQTPLAWISLSSVCDHREDLELGQIR